VFNAISSHEENMCKKIIEFLNGYSDIVTIIGSKSWSKLQRVPTISFLVRGIKSQDFVEKLDSHGIGIRYGHFYAYRLIESLGIDLNEGVIRISFVHYNSILEIETLISKMEPILCDARRILP
jgi:selenocysteine lyase/cysteine desulfurase